MLNKLFVWVINFLFTRNVYKRLLENKQKAQNYTVDKKYA